MAALFYLIILGAILVGTVAVVAAFLLPPLIALVGGAIRGTLGAAAAVAAYVAGSPEAILLIAAAGIAGAAIALGGVKLLRAVVRQHPAEPAARRPLVAAEPARR